MGREGKEWNGKEGVKEEQKKEIYKPGEKTRKKRL